MAIYASLDDRSKRGLTLVTPPAVEPVSLAQAKRHLRIDHTADDDYISDLIAVAREWVERYTRRALCRQQWCLTLDRFPVWNDVDGPYFWLYRRGVVRVVKPPVLSIEKIEYLDTAGAVQTVPAETYSLDRQTAYARIQPLYGALWPVSNLTQVAAVHVYHWSGYTDGIALPQPPEGYTPPEAPEPDPRLPQHGDPLRKVPAPIRHGILLMVAHLYENREIVSGVPGAGTSELPYGIRSLLSPYRALFFGG